VTTEGLRERKKRERRKAISDIAMGLFAQRGYDAVTVAEIARAADVSEQTVFNYFPAKEDLVFDEEEEMREALVAAIRDRPPGTSIAAGFRRVPEAMLARAESFPGQPLVGMADLISASPALQRRAREIMVANAAALAEAIAEALDLPADTPRAWSIAGALLGLQLGAMRLIVGRLRAGGERDAVLAEARAEVERGLELLESGVQPPTA
jgi:AcrR family transcriptional regulator